MKKGEQPYAFFLTYTIKKNKNMEKQQATVTNENKLTLTKIKNTPFSFATNGEKNYITCGRVLYETQKNEEETKNWLQSLPWEAIGTFIQAIVTELNNEKK